jgi:hypothetical protein
MQSCPAKFALCGASTTARSRADSEPVALGTARDLTGVGQCGEALVQGAVADAAQRAQFADGERTVRLKRSIACWAATAEHLFRREQTIQCGRKSSIDSHLHHHFDDFLSRAAYIQSCRDVYL